MCFDIANGCHFNFIQYWTLGSKNNNNNNNINKIKIYVMVGKKTLNVDGGKEINKNIYEKINRMYRWPILFKRKLNRLHL